MVLNLYTPFFAGFWYEATKDEFDTIIIVILLILCNEKWNIHKLSGSLDVYGEEISECID